MSHSNKGKVTDKSHINSRKMKVAQKIVKHNRSFKTPKKVKQQKEFETGCQILKKIKNPSLDQVEKVQFLLDATICFKKSKHYFKKSDLQIIEDCLAIIDNAFPELDLKIVKLLNNKKRLLIKDVTNYELALKSIESGESAKENKDGINLLKKSKHDKDCNFYYLLATCYFRSLCNSHFASMFGRLSIKRLKAIKNYKKAVQLGHYESYLNLIDIYAHHSLVNPHFSFIILILCLFFPLFILFFEKIFRVHNINNRKLNIYQKQYLTQKNKGLYCNYLLSSDILKYHTIENDECIKIDIDNIHPLNDIIDKLIVDIKNHTPMSSSYFAEHYRVICAERPYKNNSVQSNKLYKNGIAFITDKNEPVVPYSLFNLYHGILGTKENAVTFIVEMIKNNITHEQFAEYLFNKQHIKLINYFENTESETTNLISKDFSNIDLILCIDKNTFKNISEDFTQFISINTNHKQLLLSDKKYIFYNDFKCFRIINQNRFVSCNECIKTYNRIVERNTIQIHNYMMTPLG